MTIEKFTNDFPLANHSTYLNTAASGLMYESLMEWRQGQDIDYLISGSKLRDSAGKRIEEIRKTVAGFFDADVESTMLVPNFSFGLKTFVNGINKKKKVLLLEEDYPSVNWPFLSGGFDKVSFVKVDRDLENRIEEAFKTDEPDIFAFSIVQYISGVKIDLNFIKQLKKDYPEVIFLADGTQYCGTEAFSFKDSGIDVLGSSCYKWLLSSYFNGFMLFSERMSEMLFPDSFAFEPLPEPFLEGKNHLMYHFEPGHLDTLTLGSLNFSLQQFSTIGMEVIQDYLKELSVYAKERLSELKVISEEVCSRKEHSTIFNLEIDNKMVGAMKSRDIIFSMRGKGARVSFHIYNSKKDVDKLANILKHQ
ncbi:aminotransferase class V-fold PLP-dependent enzyme [Galbibacter sp. EGI 63066]|uniref:aminotransferase class V-fold PLP-dependent enzyme n=1 Tax=Galbibacter sp. EGI 63066 TaxID=2993559 RepID=UPI00224888BD|nr:aminotransferase class V-fold PLP-dependent enzyme [Galbibacter sp. EGI 63066]MCX2679445.1 aminotransferase class V-fold PLP-dependent enzyme [Galbibacter sp. EGI 63066]